MRRKRPGGFARASAMLGLCCLAVYVGGCTRVLSRGHVEVASEPWVYAGVSGTKLTTEHFEIHSTLRDKELEAALPDFLEAAYGQYTQLLPVDSVEGKRLRTFVFNDRRQWERFTRDHFPRQYPVYRQISAGGYARGGLCVAYYIHRAYTLAVLAHEGMHQYFGLHFDERLPAWLNEGLATYCESFELPSSGPRFTPKRNTFRLNFLREALAGGSILPLNEMLATDAGRVIVQGRSRLVKTYYAQAWAMTVYLRHGAMGRYAAGFERLLQDIESGELSRMAQSARIRAPFPEEVSYGEAVFRAYITDDLDSFEQELRNYMHELAGFKGPDQS